MGDAQDQTCASTLDLKAVAERGPAVHFAFEHGGGDLQLIAIDPSINRWLGDGAALLKAGSSLKPHLHPADLKRVEAALQEGVKQGEALEVEFRLIHEGGPPRWVHLQAHPEPGEGSECTWYGVMIDISRRRRAEAVAQGRDRLLERIATGRPIHELMEEVCRFVESQIDEATAVILMANRDQYVLQAGYSASAPPGFLEAFDGIGIGPEVGSCGTALHFGTQVISPDLNQDPKWGDYALVANGFGFYACWSTPFFSVAGEAVGTLGVYSGAPRIPTEEQLQTLSAAAHLAGIAFQREAAQDELRQTEEKLRQAQKMEAVGRLAGQIAHDFNNILTVILGAAICLQEEIEEGHPAREDADLVHDAVNRAAVLARRLTTFSRRQNWSPKWVSVGDVVMGLSPLLKRILGPEVDLLMLVEPEMELKCRVDRTQLEHVLLNLASNSKDAMPTGGTWTLKVAKGERYMGRPMVDISVSDTGVGMSANTLKHAFEPFFTTKDVGRGTGLGLATVKAVIERCEGRLEVDSSPGEGTTFNIHLPAMVQLEAEHSQASESGVGASMHAQAGERVLLVEDEQPLRALATRLLRDRGFEVQEVSSGAEALSFLERKNGQFDLLLTDITMPGMTGVELIHAVRMTYPELPIIMMSGYAEVDLSAVGEASGVPFLEKPFRPATLFQMVRATIDGTLVV